MTVRIQGCSALTTTWRGMNSADLVFLFVPENDARVFEFSKRTSISKSGKSLRQSIDYDVMRSSFDLATSTSLIHDSVI